MATDSPNYWENPNRVQEDVSANVASDFGLSKLQEAASPEIMGSSQRFPGSAVDQPSTNSSKSAIVDQMFRRQTETERTLFDSLDRFHETFSNTYSQIREEAHKQPGRQNLENEYRLHLNDFHKFASTLPQEERESVTNLVPSLKDHLTFTPPSPAERAELRAQLAGKPQLLASFDAMLSAGDKICANMSSREKELVAKAQEQSRQIDRKYEQYQDELKKNLTFQDIQKSTGNPGETRKAYNPQGDVLEIKYDDKGKPSSISYAHANMPAQEFKATDSGKFVSKNGSVFEGDLYVHTQRFRFVDESNKNNTPDRPTPRNSNNDRVPAFHHENSQPQKVPQSFRQGSGMIKASDESSKTQHQSVPKSDRERVKAAEHKPVTHKDGTKPENHSRINPSARDHAGIAREHNQKKKDEHNDRLNAHIYPKGYNNQVHDAGHSEKQRNPAGRNEQMARKGNAEHAIRLTGKPNELIKLGADSSRQIAGTVPSRIGIFKHESQGIRGIFERNTSSKHCDSLLSRPFTWQGHQPESRFRSYGDSLSQFNRRLDGNDGLKALTVRKDIIDKIGGLNPFQSSFSIKDGGKIILIAAGKALDGSKGTRGIEGKGEKSADNKAGGDKSAKGGKLGDSFRPARLEDLRTRVLRLPFGTKDQAIKLIDRLTRNPKEVCSGNDKALADALRQLNKAELNTLRWIIKGGIKPDFTGYNPKLQAQLMLIFKILLTQGSDYKAGKDKALTSNRAEFLSRATKDDRDIKGTQEQTSFINKRRHIVKAGESLKDIAFKYSGDHALAAVILYVNRLDRRIEYQSHNGKVHVILPAGSSLIIPDKKDIDEFKEANISYAHLEFGRLLASEIMATGKKFSTEISTIRSAPES